MKYSYLLLPIFAILFTSFAPDTADSEATVKWYTWEEAIKANQKNPKKLFIDVYTTWCGPCKMMDKRTFGDAKVAKYLNKNFYPIKLDAEHKEDITYKGHTFKYVKAGRRGVHTLAASLLDNNMRFPSCVFMTKDVERINILPGFMPAEDFMQVLTYINEDHFKTKTFEEYSKK